MPAGVRGWIEMAELHQPKRPSLSIVDASKDHLPKGIELECRHGGRRWRCSGGILELFIVVCLLDVSLERLEPMGAIALGCVETKCL